MGAISTLIGCVVGAGIFGVPYVIAKAGFLTGLLIIVILGIAALLVNLYLGEVSLRTKNIHSLSGLAKTYLGNKGKVIMTLAMMLGIYGGMTAYIIGEGEALSAIFPILNSEIFSLVFFITVATLIYFGVKTIEKSEIILVPAIILIVGLIVFFCLGDLNIENLKSFDFTKIFLPYGVILFAYSGVVAICEMREELQSKEKKLRGAIVWGSLIPAFLYLIFSFFVVSVSGNNTTEVATVGLGEVLGSHMVLIGNIFVVIAMATSFLATSFALKEMFLYDFKMSNFKAWLSTITIPFILAFSGYTTFINVLSFTGAIATGSIYIMVVLMHAKARKMGNRKPEFSIKGHWPLSLLLIIIFVLGILYQFVGFF